MRKIEDEERRLRLRLRLRTKMKGDDASHPHLEYFSGCAKGPARAEFGRHDWRKNNAVCWQQGSSVFPLPTCDFINCFLTSTFPLPILILSSSALSVPLHSARLPIISSFYVSLQAASH